MVKTPQLKVQGCQIVYKKVRPNYMMLPAKITLSIWHNRSKIKLWRKINPLNTIKRKLEGHLWKPQLITTEIPTTGEQIDKLILVYPYSKIWPRKKKELLTHVTIRINLKIIIPNKRSQMKKSIYCIFPFL